MSLREISAELFTAGHATKSGKPFTPQSIHNMLASTEIKRAPVAVEAVD